MDAHLFSGCVILLLIPPFLRLILFTTEKDSQTLCHDGQISLYFIQPVDIDYILNAQRPIGKGGQ